MSSQSALGLPAAFLAGSLSCDRRPAMTCLPVSSALSREVACIVETISLLVLYYVDVTRRIFAYCPARLRFYVATVLGG